MRAHSTTPHELLSRLNPDADLAARHLWLLELLQWLRGQDEPERAVARLRMFLDAIEASPEGQLRWRAWWRQFLHSVDLAPLLADYGFAQRSSFLSEYGQRLRRKLLPGTTETTDPAALFDLLLNGEADTLWLRALDDQTLARLQPLFTTDPPVAGDAELDCLSTVNPTQLSFGQTLLMDALACSLSQVSATGFSAEIHWRMSEPARQARHFQALPPQFEAYRVAVCDQGPHSAAALVAGTLLSEQLEVCRKAAHTVYDYLNEHGVSVGIVFRLRQMRERILRIRALLYCLQSDQPTQAAAELLALLAQAGQEGRSLRTLIDNSIHLTQAKVAERGAEGGEHYITRDAAEYRQMLTAAAGGGAVIAFTTWAKFGIYGLHLPYFWGGLANGLNYAFFFVLIMLLHWTVATKQPAFTASAMAAKLKDMSEPTAISDFADEVAHLLRSQIAAILGNLGAVVPVVLLICLGLADWGSASMLSVEQAHHVLQDLHLFGPSALFAAFTGVLLFASSIIAGWVENWFLLYQLDSAMAYNPRFTRVLGVERAQRWGCYWRAHISDFTANVSLGLMLGLAPTFAAFFGLGLEVRHVTLSAGQATAAAYTLGPQALSLPAFWWAVAGIVAVGLLNLGVSFYMAFRLALASHRVNRVDRRRITVGLRRRWRDAPLSFLVPPSEKNKDTEM